MMHSVVEWLALHDIDDTLSLDVLTAWEAGNLAGLPSDLVAIDDVDPVEQIGIANQLTVAFQTYIVPAFNAFFGSPDWLIAALENITFGTLDAVEHALPHTLDRGASASPIVKMNWSGSVADLVCLSHEVAHAIQLQFRTAGFMPPLAREVCAFLGELILFKHLKDNDAKCYVEALTIWSQENDVYLGDDAEILVAALKTDSADYHYRLNYPLARLAAVQIFEYQTAEEVQLLFSSGFAAMEQLPFAEMALIAADLPNYLPPVLRGKAEPKLMDNYRALGVMAVLDIDYWKGQSEKPIAEYYPLIVDHLNSETAFIKLRRDRKPLGYLLWQETGVESDVRILHQAAPFGDHLALQTAFRERYTRIVHAKSMSERSSRGEQVAW